MLLTTLIFKCLNASIQRPSSIQGDGYVVQRKQQKSVIILSKAADTFPNFLFVLRKEVGAN